MADETPLPPQNEQRIPVNIEALRHHRQSAQVTNWTKDIRTAVTPGGGRRSRGLVAPTSNSGKNLSHGKLWSLVRRALGKGRQSRKAL